MAPSLTFLHLFRQFAQATFDLRQVFESLVSIFLIDQKKKFQVLFLQPLSTKKHGKVCQKTTECFFESSIFKSNFTKLTSSFNTMLF